MIASQCSFALLAIYLSLKDQCLPGCACNMSIHIKVLLYKITYDNTASGFLCIHCLFRLACIAYLGESKATDRSVAVEFATCNIIGGERAPHDR